MSHARNPGILVDEAFKAKAGNREFLSSCPIQAKGYSDLVKIYSPANAPRQAWKDPPALFVGGTGELARIQCTAAAVMDFSSRPKKTNSRMVFIEGACGIGKSSLLSLATKNLESMCRIQKTSGVVFRHVCCDEDSFKPFSIVGPLFQAILRSKIQGEKYLGSVQLVGHSTQHEASEVEEAQMYVSLLQICLEAKIPLHYVEVMGGLIFSTMLSDIGSFCDVDTKIGDWDMIAKYLVYAILSCIKRHKLVLLALDNLSGLDEMSWKVCQGLFYCAQNVLILGAARNEYDLNINPQCWTDLNTVDQGEAQRFHRMPLEPLDEADVIKLVKERLSPFKPDPSLYFDVAHSVFLESKGNPLIAMEFLDILCPNMDNSNGKCTNVEEVILNRFDALPPGVRSALDLGAILGSPFYLADFIDVMERRKKNRDEKSSVINESIREHLNEAVRHGFLTMSEADTQGTTYAFSHSMWQKAILRQNLDSWKEETRRLVNDVFESRRAVIKTGEAPAETAKKSSEEVTAADPNQAELSGKKEKKSKRKKRATKKDKSTTKKDKSTTKKDATSTSSSKKEGSNKRLTAIAKMFRTTYETVGRRETSKAMRRFKGVLGSTSGKRNADNQQ